MNFDSFGTHDETHFTFELLKQSGKFDGLKPPNSWTSSMINACMTLEIMSKGSSDVLIQSLDFAISSMITFTTTKMTGAERVEFIKAYCLKNTPKMQPTLETIIQKHSHN
jgi:hypothetical protein